MGKYVKGLVQGELESKFRNVCELMVIQTTGINGIDNNLMRGELKKKGIRLLMVKNSMMRKALEALGMASAGNLFMAGPSAVVYGGDNIVDVAREMQIWSKKLPMIVYKGAYVEGVIIEGQAAKDLAKMPSKVELQGRIVSAALSGGARLAGAVLGPARAIAGCVKTITEKQEKEAA